MIISVNLTKLQPPLFSKYPLIFRSQNSPHVVEFLYPGVRVPKKIKIPIAPEYKNFIITGYKKILRIYRQIAI